MIHTDKWRLRPTEQCSPCTQLVMSQQASNPGQVPERLLIIHNAWPSYPTPLVSSAGLKVLGKTSWLCTHPRSPPSLETTDSSSLPQLFPALTLALCQRAEPMCPSSSCLQLPQVTQILKVGETKSMSHWQALGCCEEEEERGPWNHCMNVLQLCGNDRGQGSAVI